MTLRDFVHKQGLTMSEFQGLDEKTQQKWREVQQRKNREEQIEKNKSYKEWLKEEQEEQTAYALLKEIGVPFGLDGEPLGIGWDD